MAISPIAVGDTNSRAKINAAIEKANQVDGKASAVALQDIDSRLASQSIRVEGLLPGTRERPGDRPMLFTSSLSGAGEFLAPISVGAVVTNADGRVLRFDGVGPAPVIVAVLTEEAVEEGQVYASHWAVRRVADSSDPLGDSIEFGLACLNAQKQIVSTRVIATFNLITSDGRRSMQATYSRDQAADITLSATTRYVRPFVRIYGGDGTTDVEVIGKRDTNGLPGPKGDAGDVTPALQALRDDSIASVLASAAEAAAALENKNIAAMHAAAAADSKNAAAASAGAVGNYDTLALATAAIASIPNNGGVSVLADGANNGFYVKEGTTLVRKSASTLAGLNVALRPPQQTFHALADIQIVGATTAPVGGTALAGSTYVFSKPLDASGYITQLKGFALSAGIVRIKRFSLSGGVFTQVGSDIPVTVPAGFFSVDLTDIGYVSAQAGEYLGFWAAAPSIIPSNVGALPSDTRTPYYFSPAPANTATFAVSALTVAARIELSMQIETVKISSKQVLNIDRGASYALSGLRAVLANAGLYSPALALLEHHGAWWDLGDRTALFVDATATIAVSRTGDLIRYIRDKSGNGYDFAVTSDLYRPSYKRNALGRYSAVEFGAAHHLKAVKTGLTRKRDKITLFALARWPAPSGGQGILVHSVLENETTSRLFFGQVGITGTSRIGAIVRPTDASASMMVLSYKYLALNYNAGDWVLLECEMDWAAGDAHFFTDGSNTVEGAITFSPAAASRDEKEAAIWLGGVGPSSNPFTGEIAEIVELCGELAPETREGLYDYFSRKALDLKLGDLEAYDPLGPLPAIFFWFNGPIVIELEPDRYAVGGVSSGGSVMVGDYDFDAGTISHAVLFPRLHVDDHVPPAMTKLADGTVMAAYCTHSLDGNMWVQKTTAPNGVGSWSAAVNIGAQLKPNPAHSYQYSYAYLFRLSAEGNRLYLISRARDLTDGTPPNYYDGEFWIYSVSNDNGITWSAGKQLWGPFRPYTKVASNGLDRIDFLFNRAHPAISADNDLFHCYLQNGNFYKSDGTLIGNSTILPLDLDANPTKVYEVGSGLGNSWVWDLTYDEVTGHPVGTFVTFRSGYTQNDYYQARWDGATWAYKKICEVGGWLIPTQAAYTGGVITDPENIDVVYCSRKVADGGALSDAGVEQLFKFVTADDGMTWTGTQLTYDSKPSFRPIIAPGSRKLLYNFGDYGPNYQTFQVKVAVLDLA